MTRPLAGIRRRLPQVLAVTAAVLLLWVWIASGSLVMATLVMVLVGGVAGLGVVAASWALRRRPDGARDVAPDARPTTDLSVAPSAADPLRRALRGLLSRPWVRGDGLVRAASDRLASQDALVWTPRGQRVAAPHVWVEWRTADLADLAERWPLQVLAAELADGYVQRARSSGTRRLADRTWVHLLASDDVPVGRVVVTAAFSEPQATARASASSENTSAPAPASPERHRAVSRPPAPSELPAPPRPAPARGPAGDPPAGTAGNGPAEDGPAGNGPAGRMTAALRPRWGRPTRPERLASQTPGVADVALSGRAVALGRDPRGGVVVDDPGVSWRHLTLTRRDATTWVVTDQGSTNGTFVDGDRIAGPVVLRHGGVVGLGHDGPRFRLEAGRTPSAPRTRWYERTRQEVA